MQRVVNRVINIVPYSAFSNAVSLPLHMALVDMQIFLGCNLHFPLLNLTIGMSVVYVILFGFQKSNWDRYRAAINQHRFH